MLMKPGVDYSEGVGVEKVLLASPRGFCAGVEMAIKALAALLGAFEPPIYCYHEIVHNKQVVRRFEKLGVKFVDDIAEVPPGAPVMLSAHGSAPQVQAAAKEVSSYVVDSVCPLVTKVHHEVKVRASKGYRIVYVGHEGHEEAVGTMAVSPESIHRVETPEDVEALDDFPEPVALLAQTTLGHRDWSEAAAAARRRFPDMWTPSRSDLCFATTNRQAALERIAEDCEAFVIVGSGNSSNTVALEKLAQVMGCPKVVRVNGADDLPGDLTGTVGLTAGASAPEELVTEVLAKLAPSEGSEEIHVTDEEEYFPPPRQLRELLKVITGFAAVTLGAEPPDDFSADRRVAASEVLKSFGSSRRQEGAERAAGQAASDIASAIPRAGRA